MTRVLRAVSTTSLVMTVRSLIRRTRSIWTNRRWTRRKLPRVMRADCGDGLGVGEVGEVQGEPELAPVAAQDERELVVAKRSVLVGEADTAVALRVSGQALVDPGHANQEQPEGPPVEAVAQVLQGRCGQPVGLVDDEQVHVARR